MERHTLTKVVVSVLASSFLLVYFVLFGYMASLLFETNRSSSATTCSCVLE